jgi:hypothetical protein
MAVPVPPGATSNPAFGPPGGQVATKVWLSSTTKQVVKDVTYVIEQRFFNVFQSFKGSIPYIKQRHTGRKRQAHFEGGELGQEECEVIDDLWAEDFEELAQFYQVWLINVTLDEYYKTVSGWTAGVAGAGVGAAGAAASSPLIQTIGAVWLLGESATFESVAAVGGGIGVGGTVLGGAGLIYGGFYLTTAIVRVWFPEEELVSEGWEIVARKKVGDRQVRQGTVAHWVKC